MSFFEYEELQTADKFYTLIQSHDRARFNKYMMTNSDFFSSFIFRLDLGKFLHVKL